ncbi:g3559 [Coccomyxa elongata]
MIDIYAPWCKHCAVLEPVWTSLAERLEGKVMVGKVDGTREKALMKRFSCEAFPSIYYVAGPDTRVYAGLRTLQELEKFAMFSYKDVKPLPFYRSPTSFVGRASGNLIRLPARFQALVKYLHEEKKYSALAILAGILGVPLSTGVLLVYMLDVFFGARARSRTHQHRD